MITSKGSVAFCSWRAVAIAVALMVARMPALAVDNGTNNTGKVDCGDSKIKDACIECCTTLTCLGKIICCPLVGSCTVVNKSTSSSLPLRLSEVVGGLKLSFERDITKSGVDLKLRMSFLRSVFPKSLKIKAHLTGNDAQTGALLYAILFLLNGPSAIDMLHSGGYDVTVTGTFPTCQEMFPSQLCNDMAFGLSRSIYGAVGVGLRSELDAFLNGTNAFGDGPCFIIG